MPAPNNILIVEDEPLIAMMLEDFLEILDKNAAGVVDTVAGALDVIAEGNVDAAILDVNLRGGETSWPVAEALEAKGIPFVFASGGSNGSVPEHLRNRPTLAKPFTMDSVAKVLAALG